jgi:hypothetical protein
MLPGPRSVPLTKPPTDADDEDEPLVDPGRSLGLRLLAVLGAVSFLMLGVSSVVGPLLQPTEPPPRFDDRDRAAS